MLITVEGKSTPGNPTRSLLLASGLFALSMVLAGSLAAQRRANPVIQDQGIQCHPPRGFRLAESYGDGRFKYYLAQDRRHEPDVLMVFLVSAPTGTDALEFANRITQVHRFVAGTGDFANETQIPAPVGSVMGIEIQSLNAGRVLRLGEIAPGEYAVILLSMSEGSIKPSLYSQFKKTCESVRVDFSGH